MPPVSDSFEDFDQAVRHGIGKSGSTLKVSIEGQNRSNGLPKLKPFSGSRSPAQLREPASVTLLNCR
jgi:hypothetical protein